LRGQSNISLHDLGGVFVESACHLIALFLMNANGINKSMAIFGFGALDDAMSAPALVRQEFHSFCFIEALPSAGEVLRNFDVIAGVIDDIGLRRHEVAISSATGEQY